MLVFFFTNLRCTPTFSKDSLSKGKTAINMKWIYSFLVILSFARFGCVDQHDGDCLDSSCTQVAIVKDLTGLDGCGFALELENGSRLIPQKLTYIQAPDKNQDPGYHFNFIDGQKVCFGFRETEGVDACMAGKLVFLTCIRVCEPEQK